MWVADFDPIVFHVGSFAVRWYSLAYVCGFFLGYFYALYVLVPRCSYDFSAKHLESLSSWCVVGVIVGGRLGYVLFYGVSYYRDVPWEVLYLWKGGMSFHGGYIGVLGTVYLYCRVHRLSFLQMGDLVSLVAPIGLGLGRIANFINGELYGRQSPELLWGVIFPRGGEQPRHPSQLYEALLEGVLLGGILFFLSGKTWIKNYPGAIAGIFAVLYGVFRFFVEFYREPDAHLNLFFHWMSMGQILALPHIFLGFVLLVWAGKFSVAQGRQEGQFGKK